MYTEHHMSFSAISQCRSNFNETSLKLVDIQSQSRRGSIHTLQVWVKVPAWYRWGSAVVRKRRTSRSSLSHRGNISPSLPLAHKRSHFSLLLPFFQSPVSAGICHPYCALGFHCGKKELLTYSSFRFLSCKNSRQKNLRAWLLLTEGDKEGVTDSPLRKCPATSLCACMWYRLNSVCFLLPPNNRPESNLHVRHIFASFFF